MMIAVENLSPARPLKFGAINPRHHATGGAEIFGDAIRISLRPGEVTNLLLSHELAHVLIGLEHPHLGISDQIPRGTPDRRMIGTLLSMFEHPAVFEIQREYGFDVPTESASKIGDYVADLERLPPERQPNVYIEKIQGYVELHYLIPDDPRWPDIERIFAGRAPRSYANARDIYEHVVTPARVQRHEYKHMLDALVHVLGLQNAYWPPLVELRPAARSDTDPR
jgi:hypothetical protein